MTPAGSPDGPRPPIGELQPTSSRGSRAAASCGRVAGRGRAVVLPVAGWRASVPTGVVAAAAS
ncbi:hypothetical protein QJS66_13265 [Kocuria rhizophila]|nr:hypothetical protein QJS66_13265 [Kocuria rhizophila]